MSDNVNDVPIVRLMLKCEGTLSQPMHPGLFRRVEENEVGQLRVSPEWHLLEGQATELER